MLETIDLSKQLDKQEYKTRRDPLRLQLAALQRRARELKIPVMIVFEGWDAAGKGTLINRLILPLDPRGFKVHPINQPTEEERYRPFLWRFWIKTPAKGRIAVFDRSWYGRVLVERVEEIVKEKEWRLAYEEIRNFERQLADDGCVIIKFFLHISRDEQKKRFKKIRSNPALAWKVGKDDLKRHKKYKQYLQVYEEMIQETDSEYARWNVIEATDRRFATIKIFTKVAAALQRRINAVEAGESTRPAPQPVSAREAALDASILGTVDLSCSLEREEYEAQLDKYQERVRELEHEIYMQRIPLVIVYEGWDAAGKGGNIKRLTREMDPRGYEVVPIAAPNDVEKAHHYLWRFWMAMPKAGHITIFDRSWYGRVMVERVEGFCSEQEWRRAYREINEMEDHLTSFGAVLIKFWIQIDKEEQLKRFKAREATPHKKWKITDEDWRNREKWDQYQAAVDEMLHRTSTTYAPWTIVESNCKWYARIKALKTVIERVEERL